jgi:hypothetical protein
MKKKNTILYAGFGLWISGMLIGANAVDFLPGEPSWPPWLILVIGILTTFGCSRVLYLTNRQTGSK